MRKDLLVNVNDTDIVLYEEQLMMASEAFGYAFPENQGVSVFVFESAKDIEEYENQIEPVYPRPQVFTVFIPNFKTKRIKLRSEIMSDDWVADCYALDKKYGVWFMTLEQATKILERNSIIEI